MARVVLEHVDKVYPGQVKAVNDFCQEIADEEFMVLVGPSGCGKSTTLRMVAGLEEITAGRITIGDRVVNDVPPKDRNVAMVFQNYALYPHMTVRENMAFGLKIRKLPKDEIEKRIQDTARLLQLSNLLDRRPKALSGGQRQRVAVGRAIVRKPAVFLFDEPLSNLDARLRVEMRAELKKLHERLKTTVIYVTHDQVEAMTLGDRVTVMRDGVIQQVGKPMELYDRPVNRFVANFLGTPPMNFLAGRIERRDGVFAFVKGPARLRLAESIAPVLAGREDREVELGIRPESIEILTAPTDSSLQARVEVVEPLGEQTQVYFDTAQQSIVAMVDAHRQISPGDNFWLSVRPGRLHVFDLATGESLSCSSTGKEGAMPVRIRE